VRALYANYAASRGPPPSVKNRTDAPVLPGAELGRLEPGGSDDERFEQLLGDLSVALVGIPGADLEAAIRDGLARIVAVLDVDVGVVLDTADQRIRITHAYVRRGRRAELPESPEIEFAWLAERVASGEVTRLTRLGELPPEAADDRRSLAQHGIRSAVVCPVVVDGGVTGAVAFASIGRERDWPDALVDRLRLIGRMFAGALARRRAEERLAAEREFAEAVIESLPGMFFMLDGQGRLLRWNKNREVVMGYSADELRGHHFSEFFSADDNARIQTALDTASREGTGFSEHHVLTKDGRRIPYLATGRIATIRGRSYAIGIGMDISALKTAENQVRRHQAELAHVARVSAMGELAAAIAHELNQPLTAIRTNAQATRRMLARGGMSAAEFDEALADITSDAVRAGEIIRRLRDLLRKGDGERLPLDVNEVIRAVGPFARADALEHDVVLVMDLAARLPRVLGDRIQLQQVILNLIRNGSEAMRGDSVRRRELVVATALATGFVEVTVRDSGPRLSDEEFARMFQPFYTTKADGLGIGLSLGRSIIEAHGGLLWATRNDMESGITMHFTLPVETAAR